MPDARGNLIGGPVHGVINPLLGPLANNGGPTMTHALLVDSPAIDAGDPAAMAGMNGVPEFDQRGEPHLRVRDGDATEDIAIDIGAYERELGRRIHSSSTLSPMRAMGIIRRVIFRCARRSSWRMRMRGRM